MKLELSKEDINSMSINVKNVAKSLNQIFHLDCMQKITMAQI